MSFSLLRLFLEEHGTPLKFCHVFGYFAPRKRILKLYLVLVGSSNTQPDEQHGRLILVDIILRPPKQQRILWAVASSNYSCCHMKPSFGQFMIWNWHFLSKRGVHRITAMQMASFGFKTTIETFQMRYCMTFYLKGHQNCHNLEIWTFHFT